MKVLVAMSGGVDSSVAAARLVSAGHDVTGVTLKLWGGESDTGCCSISDVSDARRVADALGIEHHTFAYSEEFNRGVVEPYLEAHSDGQTPNPCIECNRQVKFGALYERAERLGFDAIATGHHARIGRGEDGLLRVRRGADEAKDQSYVLAGIGPERLERVLFPVGDSLKPQLRSEAQTAGLLTATKPDSQDVCFITRNQGRAQFLGQRIPLRSATVTDSSGKVLGEVAAAETITVGQRRGLPLPGGTAPHYVLSTDPNEGRVVVGTIAELMVDRQPLSDLNWASDPAAEYELAWQVSAHGATRAGTVDRSGEPTTISWFTPQRRVAPGQTLVAYRGDLVEAWGSAAR